MVYSKRCGLEIYPAVLDTLGIQCQFRILNFGFIYRVILRHYRDTLAGPILLLKLWLLCEKSYPLRADETDSKTLMRGVAPCAGKLTTPSHAVETQRANQRPLLEQTLEPFSYMDHMESYSAVLLVSGDDNWPS